MTVFNFNGIRQQYAPAAVVYDNLVDGINVIEFTVDFSRFAAESLYYFVLQSGSIKFYSDFICVKNLHDNTVLISYANSVNDQNVIFSTNILFNLRVEIEDKSTPKTLVPKAVESIYDNDMGGYMTLYSNPYETYRINIGGVRGIPDWLMVIINRALSCDTVFLNNKKANKIEGAEFEAMEAEFYPLRSWIIEVSYADEEEGEMIYNYLIDNLPAYLIDNDNNYLVA
jgi:hypothetical protein